MPTAHFYHHNIGNLTIDTGLDDAQWAYGLNTANFSTYGGEVVQILSVYIDDLTLRGTVSTYKQVEAIYKYFTAYFMVSTQGQSPTPNIGDSVDGSAYNLYPVLFSYPERNWFFKLYPKSAPGFRYGRDVIAPTWELTSFVVDDAADLDSMAKSVLSRATPTPILFKLTRLPSRINRRSFIGIQIITTRLSQRMPKVILRP